MASVTLVSSQQQPPRASESRPEDLVKDTTCLVIPLIDQWSRGTIQTDSGGEAPRPLLSSVPRH